MILLMMVVMIIMMMVMMIKTMVTMKGMNNYDKVTPSLDRLAESSLVLEQAFVQVLSPSALSSYQCDPVIRKQCVPQAEPQC